MASVCQRYEDYVTRLRRVGQAHLLAFWPRLNETERTALLDDLDQIDFDRCAALADSHVRCRPVVPLPESVEPPPIYPAEPGKRQAELYARAREAGEQAIRAGRVAAFTVAGGQGTRLGFAGPKGAYPISPIRSATLFQLFAEALLGAERKYGHRPRWYIMTSIVNHAETASFFEAHRHFGLTPDDVVLFQQAQMPAFLPDGRIALAEPHRVALAPNGHGGSLWALADSGALDDMRARGVDTISYFQVDNPLVQVLDPVFIGLHLLADSEMSSKAVTKAHDTERVGNFCLADGKIAVIEYSDLPDELATSKNPDGTRRFDAGSIAIHVLSRAFVERLTARDSNVRLPWHRADKKVPVVSDSGEIVTPKTPNAVKLEMFVFDAIPLAHNPLVMYTKREEEFSPVKNAEGDDSPATARRDMIRRAAHWLEDCGVAIPRDPNGESAVRIEISPAFALDSTDLRGRLHHPLTISPQEPLLLI